MLEALRNYSNNERQLVAHVVVVSAVVVLSDSSSS